MLSRDSDLAAVWWVANGRGNWGESGYDVGPLFPP